MLYEQQQNIDEAIHYVYQLCELQPNDFNALARLAQLYIFTSQDEKAINILLKAQNIAETMHQEWIQQHLGILYLRTEQYEKSYTILKPLPLREQELWVAYHKALACMAMQQYVDAIESLEFLFAQPQYEDEILYRLAYCYIKTNQNKKFQSIYSLCEDKKDVSNENKQLFDWINDIAFTN